MGKKPVDITALRVEMYTDQVHVVVTGGFPGRQVKTRRFFRNRDDRKWHMYTLPDDDCILEVPVEDYEGLDGVVEYFTEKGWSEVFPFEWGRYTTGG